jgi:hypothetical protein
MSVSATALRTVSFPDTPEALLRYLAERTSETVGRRVKRADAADPRRGHVRQRAGDARC